VITHESIYFMKRGRKGWAALKIDISKAYDRINYEYLMKIMLKLGFASKWVELVMLCVKSVLYSICFNITELGPIKPSRGSFFLIFIYLMQWRFYNFFFFWNAKACRKVYGYKVSQITTLVSHLLFANDSFLFFIANAHEDTVIKHLLH